MYEYYTRIYVPLGRDEFIALRESAENSYRHPRDQARYLLRLALGLEDTRETVWKDGEEQAAEKG